MESTHCLQKNAGETCDDICDKLSSWANDNLAELKAVTKDSFENYRPDFNWWKLAIINKRRPRNELTLYCLCKMYHRHTIIYSKTEFWTTLENRQGVPEEKIVTKYDIVYLGSNKFCEVIITDKDSANKQTTRSRSCATRSIQDICNQIRSQKTMPLVKLNPTKHGHDTRGTVHKRFNDRPNRVKSLSVSYVPDPTSSEAENEPPHKKHRTTAVNLPDQTLTGPSGPSEARMRTQNMITCQKLQTKKNATSRLIGTYLVSPSAKIKVKDEKDCKTDIKSEIKIEQSKPLTKEQKERRRRRNRREFEETE